MEQVRLRPTPTYLNYVEFAYYKTGCYAKADTVFE